MTTNCRYEQDVMRGDWSDSLRRHIETCDECSATAAVAEWMNRFAGLDDRQHRLPDPTLVYLKAQLLQQTKTVDRAARPMTIANIVSYAVIASGWAALLTWRWDAVARWLASFSPKHVVIGVAMNDPSAVTLSTPFFLTLIILASATMMLALHTILAEE